MLVVTRKENETIIIDGRITIRIGKVKGDSVRIGVDAPKSMNIARGELLKEGDKDHDRK
jgi:carbon storage regulator